VIDHGKVIALGSLAELRAMIGERDVLRLAGTFQPEAAVEALGHMESLEIVQAEEDGLLMTLEQASRRLPEIFAALTASGAEVRETTMTQPSLESLFIKITGRELRE